MNKMAKNIFDIKLSLQFLSELQYFSYESLTRYSFYVKLIGNGEKTIGKDTKTEKVSYSMSHKK